jgi:RNAse (barnase) inhibitor barstar
MVSLDGKEFLDKDSSYEYLNQELDFDYYVKNLDALYDSLTMVDCDIEIINYRDIYTNLDEYGKSMLGVFLDASLNDYINLNLKTFGD